MARFTVKWLEKDGGYYSVRKDGKEIGGHRLKQDAQAIMHAAKRKYEAWEKSRKTK